MSEERRQSVSWPWNPGGGSSAPREVRWSNAPYREFGRAESREDEHWMPLDPRCRRQVSDVIVLWRGPSDAREGLVLAVRPEVSGRALGSVAALDVLRVNGVGAVAVCDGTGGLEVIVAGPGPDGRDRILEEAASVTVDLALGETIADESEPFDAEVASWISSELDAELLDRVHRETLTLSGVDPCDRGPLASLCEWRPGRRLPFAAAYPWTRVDRLRVEGRICYVEEHYCPDPNCLCREVVLEVFARGNDRSTPEKIGTVRLAPPFREAEFELSPAENEASLFAILDRYRDRYPDPEHFEERRLRIAVVGALLEERRDAVRQRTARRARRRRPGGNDPCPCGSGRTQEACCSGRKAGS